MISRVRSPGHCGSGCQSLLYLYSSVGDFTGSFVHEASMSVCLPGQWVGTGAGAAALSVLQGLQSPIQVPSSVRVWFLVRARVFLCPRASVPVPGEGWLAQSLLIRGQQSRVTGTLSLWPQFTS